MKATWPSHLILLASNSLTIFSRNWKSWNSSSCSFVSPHVIPPSSLQISFWPPISWTLSANISHLMWEGKFHTHKKTADKIIHLWSTNSTTEYCELYGSKYSVNLFCCYFLCEGNFDLLVLFSNILTLPHFQTFYSLNLYNKTNKCMYVDCIYHLLFITDMLQALLLSSLW